MNCPRLGEGNAPGFGSVVDIVSFAHNLSFSSFLWRKKKVTVFVQMTSGIDSAPGLQGIQRFEYGRRVGMAQVIIEGRKEQSDGGEKNKDYKHNPKQQPKTHRVSTIMESFLCAG